MSSAQIMTQDEIDELVQRRLHRMKKLHAEELEVEREKARRTLRYQYNVIREVDELIQVGRFEAASYVIGQYVKRADEYLERKTKTWKK